MRNRDQIPGSLEDFEDNFLKWAETLPGWKQRLADFKLDLVTLFDVNMEDEKHADLTNIFDAIVVNFLEELNTTKGRPLKKEARSHIELELLETKKLVAVLKDDRLRQEAIHKQYAEEAAFLRDKIRRRDQMLAAQRNDHLKELLADKERYMKLQLQLEQKETAEKNKGDFSNKSAGESEHSHQQMVKMTQELLNIRTEKVALQQELSDAHVHIEELERTLEQEPQDESEDVAKLKEENEELQRTVENLKAKLAETQSSSFRSIQSKTRDTSRNSSLKSIKTDKTDAFTSDGDAATPTERISDEPPERSSQVSFRAKTSSMQGSRGEGASPLSPGGEDVSPWEPVLSPTSNGGDGMDPQLPSSEEPTRSLGAGGDSNVAPKKRDGGGGDSNISRKKSEGGGSQPTSRRSSQPQRRSSGADLNSSPQKNASLDKEPVSPVMRRGSAAMNDASRTSMSPVQRHSSIADAGYNRKVSVSTGNPALRKVSGRSAEGFDIAALREHQSRELAHHSEESDRKLREKDAEFNYLLEVSRRNQQGLVAEIVERERSLWEPQVRHLMSEVRAAQSAARSIMDLFAASIDGLLSAIEQKYLFPPAALEGEEASEALQHVMDRLRQDALELRTEAASREALYLEHKKSNDMSTVHLTVQMMRLRADLSEAVLERDKAELNMSRLEHIIKQLEGNDERFMKKTNFDKANALDLHKSEIIHQHVENMPKPLVAVRAPAPPNRPPSPSSYFGDASLSPLMRTKGARKRGEAKAEGDVLPDQTEITVVREKLTTIAMVLNVDVEMEEHIPKKREPPKKKTQDNKDEMRQAISKLRKENLQLSLQLKQALTVAASSSAHEAGDLRAIYTAQTPRSQGNKGRRTSQEGKADRATLTPRASPGAPQLITPLSAKRSMVLDQAAAPLSARRSVDPTGPRPLSSSSATPRNQGTTPDKPASGNRVAEKVEVAAAPSPFNALAVSEGGSSPTQDQQITGELAANPRRGGMAPALRPRQRQVNMLSIGSNMFGEDLGMSSGHKISSQSLPLSASRRPMSAHLLTAEKAETALAAMKARNPRVEQIGQTPREQKHQSVIGFTPRNMDATPRGEFQIQITTTQPESQSKQYADSYEGDIPAPPVPGYPSSDSTET